MMTHFAGRAIVSENNSMPVSVANSKVIYQALKACDVRIVSALPETWLVHLIRMAEEDPEMKLVRLAKEHHARAVIVGTHGRRRLLHQTIGSTACAVVEQATCPAMVIRHAEADRWATVDSEDEFGASRKASVEVWWCR